MRIGEDKEMINAPILLVEDNPDDVEMTLLAFSESNLANEIVVARDGEEALSYLFAEGIYSERSPEASPALMLLDLKLPKIDGLEVLRRARADKRTKLMPVVILTSSKEEQDIIESYELGANSYVRKPVDFEKLVEAANHLHVYWLILNELPPRRV